MTTREIDSGIVIEASLQPAVLTTNNTTVAGTGIDLRGFEAAEVVVQVGLYAESIAGAFSEFSVQESDDDTTYTDVANADLTDTVAATCTVTGASTTGLIGKVSSTSNDNVVIKSGYKGSKRYIRVKENAEKNHNVGLPVSAVIVKAKPSAMPQ